MRRNRRGGGGHGVIEFGGSGEDSFVAVVVTKLTGALLFILLLTMVIMALLPKAVDLAPPGRSGEEVADDAAPLSITTPDSLPEAIAGHPYALALAASGGRGPLTWSVAGPVPDGLSVDGATGLIRGTARAGTPKPVELVLRVSDGVATATRAARLLVYQSDRPLTTPAWWKPGLPPVPWRAWLEQGFGFLVLWLVHLVGMNGLGSLERWSVGASGADVDPSGAIDLAAAHRRFTFYRATLRLASLGAAAALALWLWQRRG
jgi:hypothetical protein